MARIMLISSLCFFIKAFLSPLVPLLLRYQIPVNRNSSVTLHLLRFNLIVKMQRMVNRLVTQPDQKQYDVL